MQTPGEVWPYWQPLATAFAGLCALTGAAIAVCGVRATLKQNRKQQSDKYEQMRLMDRYTRLFALYGDFYAAASDYLINMTQLIPTMILVVSEKPVHLATPGTAPVDDESLRRRIRIEEHAEELRKDCLERQVLMMAALSRLSLMNDAQSRMDMPLQDIVRVNNITVNSRLKDANNLRLDLRNRQRALGYQLAVAFGLPGNAVTEIKED